jgi:surface carbohydrate biosynthesis protein
MKLARDLPTVLLPIETATRELDSKLVMASALAAQGCRAIVGHKETLKEVATASKRVIWQGKSLFSAKSDNHLADRLNERNSAIMFIHDEGGMHQVKAWEQHVLKTHRIEHLRKRKMDRVCVWGERQKDLLSTYATELQDFITITGSPRFDLCLPRFSWVTHKKSEEKRGKYGPYILMCTRFGTANHSQGTGDPFRRKMNPTLWPEGLGQAGIADVWYAKWHRDVHDFADFVVLIKEIASQHPRHTIIVRPHPSENATFYEQAFSSFSNVRVTKEDSVLPWIRSVDLVVHSNCTTGIESVLAGRPVLNFLPASDTRAEFDVEVAREAGYTASSIEDALQKSGELLAGSAPCHVWSTHAQAILHNLKGETIPLLVKETMSVLRETGITSSSVELPKRRPLRNAIKRLVRGRSTSYAASKRGPLDPSYIESLLEECRLHHGGKGCVHCATGEYVVVDPA